MDANAKEFMMEDCKGTWRENARAHALQDLKAQGIQGEAAEKFYNERFAEYYAELERIGLEGIQ